MNRQSKSFLNNLTKSIDQAQITRFQIQEALRTGGVLNEQGAIEYLQALRKYIQAGEEMLMQFRIAYGENQKQLAKKAVNSYVTQNGAS